MDLQSIVFAPLNDLPDALFLPAFANVSQYHGLLKGELAKSPAATTTATSLKRSAARAHRRTDRSARDRCDGGERRLRDGVRSRHRGDRAAYTMAAMAYFGEQLGMNTDTRYEVLSHDTNKNRNWNRGEDKGNSYATTSPDLARAMRRNARLMVFVASGRYDLGTPYSASDWSIAQLNAPADVLVRVKHHYYDAGHMMYAREADLTRLKGDLAGRLAS